jgi:hypothetical protein
MFQGVVAGGKPAELLHVALLLICSSFPLEPTILSNTSFTHSRYDRDIKVV